MSNGLDPKRAPMASAPMKYAADGSVNWGDMWDTFCALAQEGGPPHRAQMLDPQIPGEADTAAYQTVVTEIARGIEAVSGLPARAGAPGWVEVNCASAEMASWLADAIKAEHVQAQSEGAFLLVPAGAEYTLTGEIKNVITVVAKTGHYWQDHLPPDVKQLLVWQGRLTRAKLWLMTRLHHQPT